MPKDRLTHLVRDALPRTDWDRLLLTFAFLTVARDKVAVLVAVVVRVAAAVPTAQVACQINVLLEPVAVELALAATKELTDYAVSVIAR